MKVRPAFLISFFLFFQLSVFSQDMAKAIDSIAGSYIQPYSGMAILVVKDGVEIYKQGHGYANLESKTPVNVNTRFNLGPLSRQITVLALLQLVESNKLSLDEKLTDIIDFPAFGKEISVYHLLTHTSGLPSYLGLIERDRATPVANTEVLNLMRTYGKTDFEPGTRYRVSATDYALLAMVVEKKSGMRFDRYLQRRLFRPLGIREQVVAQKNMNRIKNRATGYIFRGDTGFIPNDPGLYTTIHGEAGIYLSLDEYKKVLDAMNQDGLLKESTRTMIFTPARYKSGNEIYPQVGLGWSAGQEKRVNFFYQSGPNNGFTSYVITLPSENLTVVLLSNQAGLFQILDKIIYPIVNLYTNHLFKERIR